MSTGIRFPGPGVIFLTVLLGLHCLVIDMKRMPFPMRIVVIAALVALAAAMGLLPH